MFAFLMSLLFGSPAVENVSSIEYCYNEISDESVQQGCTPIGGRPGVTRVNGPDRSVPPSEFP